jgi:S1-C subfamily serine protease
MAASVALGGGSAAAAAEAIQPSVDLARINTDKLLGKTWITTKIGLFCSGTLTSEWTSKDTQGFTHSAILLSLFRDELTKAGFKSESATADLFAPSDGNVEVQVGALVTGFQVETCAVPRVGRLNEKGHASMDIEWQIYSTSQGKIVERVPIHSEIDVPVAPDGRAKLLRGVFANNAHALLTSGEFIKAMQTLGSAGAQMASPASLSELHPFLPAATQPLSLDQAQRGVVSIFTAGAWGSGVLISPDGYLLTNHHVAGDAGHVRVRWANGAETVGEVVRADKRRDVALIKTFPPNGTPVLAIRHSEVRLGETVYAIGTPLNREFSGTLTRGVVSTVNRKEGGLPFIQSDVAVDHGNSGGPLLDEQGHVVGLTDWGYSPDGVSHNLNFFIPIDDALKALALTLTG